MTASEASSKLPLWRLIAGISVLGILAMLLVLAGVVYFDNFLLDRYMRSLARQPALSDSALKDGILARAGQLNLPVRAGDITVTRNDGKPHIHIARYGVQTYLGRMDLRLPAAESR